MTLNSFSLSLSLSPCLSLLFTSNIQRKKEITKFTRKVFHSFPLLYSLSLSLFFTSNIQRKKEITKFTPKGFHSFPLLSLSLSPLHLTSKERKRSLNSHVNIFIPSHFFTLSNFYFEIKRKGINGAINIDLPNINYSCNQTDQWLYILREPTIGNLTNEASKPNPNSCSIPT